MYIFREEEEGEKITWKSVTCEIFLDRQPKKNSEMRGKCFIVSEGWTPLMQAEAGTPVYTVDRLELERRET